MQAAIEQGRGGPALRSLLGWYIRLVEAVAGVTMAIIVVVMVTQVIARYVFGGSLIWAEELCRYILIWQTFFLLGLAFSRGEFVMLDFLPQALPRGATLALKVLMAVPILIFLAIIVSNGFDYASRFQRQTIPALDFISETLTGEPLGLPITYVYVAVPVGSLLLALHVVASLVADMLDWRAGTPAPGRRGARGGAVMGAFFGIFALLLVTGVPIALALGIGGTAYLWLSGNGGLMLALPQRMMAGVDQFVLLTIPLFLLAGALMNVGGITDRIVTFAKAMVGHRRGGMSSVTVLSSGFFAGISGSATAEAAALGSILIPTMARQGVPTAYAAALVGVSSIVGPIIPPSITMIIYGVLSGTSIGQLFLAGVAPGIGVIAGLLVYAGWRARRSGFPVTEKMPWNERSRAVLQAAPALILPLIIIVGIKGGIFTPTEAAAVAVAYALVVGLCYRELTAGRIWRALIATAVVSSSILFITSMANIVSFVFTLEQVPTHIAELMLSITDSRLLILLMLNIFLILLGMFLEPISILILTMPILMKMAAILSMDPVHFGAMVVLNVVIGLATPPVGILLFIVSAASGAPLIAVIREAIPLILIAVAVLAVVALVPAFSLFLPNVLFGG